MPPQILIAQMSLTGAAVRFAPPTPATLSLDGSNSNASGAGLSELAEKIGEQVRVVVQ
jgi:hypothetical protein